MACACCGKPIFTHLAAANVQIGNTPKTVIATPYSNDYRIDVLIEGRSVSWNPGGNTSVATPITYSFALTPAYLTGNNAKGFTPFTAVQKEAVRSFLNFANSILNINFTEVTETTSATTPYGQIRMANVTTDSAGYALMPGVDGPEDGDVFISTSTIDSSYAPGSYDYDTLIHEVAHGIGLKHPGNYNAEGPPSTEPGNYLASSEDSKLISVVSYVEHPQGLQRIDFGPYDLLALNYLYGLRPYKTDNTSYRYSDAVGKQLQTIYDTGGTDTIDMSQVSTPTIINLNGGASSSAGRISSDSSSAPAQNNLQIAFGTEIERVIGSPQADQITGNGAANILTGGGGDDTINGGSGIDTAVFAGTRAQYSLSTQSAGGFRVTDSVATRNGADTVAAVERLQFSDLSLALDLEGNAGKVAKILGAIFGQSAVSNKSYVGIGLSYLDSGMSYSALAALAVSVTGKSSSTEVCTLLWTNVIKTTPTAADIAPYKAMLDSGQMSIGALATLAAETNFNTTNIGLVGLSQTGIEYV
jgi:serralysin